MPRPKKLKTFSVRVDEELFEALEPWRDAGERSRMIVQAIRCYLAMRQLMQVLEEGEVQ